MSLLSKVLGPHAVLGKHLRAVNITKYYKKKTSIGGRVLKIKQRNFWAFTFHTGFTFFYYYYYYHCYYYYCYYYHYHHYYYYHYYYNRKLFHFTMEAPIKIKRHLNRQAALINRWFSSYPTKLQETYINKTPEIRQESSDISGTWLIITFGITFPAKIKLRIAEDWHFKIKDVFLAWISIDDL